MFDFESQFDSEERLQRAGASRPAPGKVTLTSRLPPRPRAEPGEAFASATEGEASTLPYRALLEPAFGVDLGGVTAHLGTPEARDGLSDLGARAAAFGDAVAFADPDPSLHLVAHEVAHVVQQRNGGGRVQAKAVRVSDVGDAAEHAADRAADAIVRGQRVPDVGRADAGAIHRDPELLESGPQGQTWSMEVDGGRGEHDGGAGGGGRGRGGARRRHRGTGRARAARRQSRRRQHGDERGRAATGGDAGTRA